MMDTHYAPRKPLFALRDRIPRTAIVATPAAAVGNPWARSADGAPDAGPDAGAWRRVPALTPALRALADDLKAVGRSDPRVGAALLGRGAVGLLVFGGNVEVARSNFLRVRPAPVVMEVVPDDPAGAARELYAALRRLDESSATILFHEPWPDADVAVLGGQGVAAAPPSSGTATGGLHAALRDRLRRAARPRLG